jgi:hypothetical protein
MSLEIFAGMLFLGIFAAILTGLAGLMSFFWHAMIHPSIDYLRRLRNTRWRV